MKKRSEFAVDSSMTLEIKCEHGHGSLQVDISHLTRTERLFLFNLLQIPQQGGDVGFGVEPDASGAKVIKFLLVPAPSIEKAVSAAVEKAANGSH
jgi:hypothetical protein